MAKTSKATAPSTVADLSALLVAPKTPALAINPAPAEKSAVKTATWTGVLQFGNVSVGVKTYKATEEEKVSFNNVHCCNSADVAKSTGKVPVTPVYNQLKQGKSRCETCDRDVEAGEIVSGYKYAEGMYAILSKDEKKAVLVQSDKLMSIDKFVKSDSIDPIYFASTEYLVPEKGFESLFSLLREAMTSKDVVAVASANQKGREQTVVVRPYGTNGLVIHYMYFDNEVRTCDKWQTVANDAAMLKAAKGLIDHFMGNFDVAEYEDASMRRLKGLVNDKVLGNFSVAPPAPVVPVANAKADVMAQLLSSLNAPKPVRKPKALAMAAAAGASTSSAVTATA
jgi:DNA end-binding protein Ku